MRMPRDHDTEEPECLSTVIVETVAEAENTTPDALTPRIFDVVDPDALDQLLGRGDESTSVTFSYGRWEVHARGDGTVDVSRPPDGV